LAAQGDGVADVALREALEGGEQRAERVALLHRGQQLAGRGLDLARALVDAVDPGVAPVARL